MRVSLTNSMSSVKCVELKLKKAKLKLEHIKKETLHLNTFGDNKFTRQSCKVYKLVIENKNGGTVVELTTVNFPVICSPLRSRVNIDYTHLDGLELADSSNDNDSDSIDILIGADHYWDVVTGDIVRGESGPTAISSKLGWLLSGRTESNGKDDDPTVANLILTGESNDRTSVLNHNDKIVDSLKRFWETESIGIIPCLKITGSSQKNFLSTRSIVTYKYTVSRF